MFVPQREATIPANVLLQDLNNITKMEGEKWIGFLWLVGVDNWEGEGREETVHIQVYIQWASVYFHLLTVGSTHFNCADLKINSQASQSSSSK